jgi:hypothetical protein
MGKGEVIGEIKSIEKAAKHFEKQKYRNIEISL